MRKKWIASTAVLVLLSACSGNNNESAVKDPDARPATEPPKPVTLNVFTDASAAIDIEQELVQKKFPHITLNVIKNGKDTRIEAVVGSGQRLDLINHSMGSIWKLLDLQLLSDLTPYIDKYKFDLNRYVPGVVESMRSYSAKGELIALPYELNSSVLFYNKTIFNKFGVPYPKDGITWDEVYDLAKRLTKQDGGVQYKGFQFQHQNLTWKNQLGLPVVDATTNKALVNTDGWKRFLETMGRFYSIPGNEYTDSDTNNFLVKQVLAMRVGPNILSSIPEAVKTGLDWDVAAVPLFAGNASGGSQLIAPFYSIPVGGANKETAFQVMEFLLSPEVQLLKSRSGKMPIVKDPAAIEAFAADIEGVQGKNMGAFFKEAIGKPIKATRFDAIAKDEIWGKALKGYYEQNKDLNTVLREAEEAVNKKISEQLQM